MKRLNDPGVFIKNMVNGGEMDEDEIMRLSDFNKRIIDSAPISIITIDKNGIITFTNKYFKKSLSKNAK